MAIRPEIKYPLPLKIVGMGHYLPKRIVSNSELESRCGLPEGWCERKQGIRERRWVENETLSFMGAEAAREAVAASGLKLSGIDLIISAGQSFQQAVPDNGPMLQRQLGLGESGIPCLNISSACLSFLVALDISASLIALGCYRNILIVTAEITTSNLDFNDPNVCTMMGDGAAAALVTQTPEGESATIHAALMETYSEASYVSSISGSNAYRTFFSDQIRRDDFTFAFEPQSLQRSGMKYNKRFLAKLWPASNSRAFKLIIPNQSSRLVLDYAKLVYPSERVMGIIDRCGNCGSVGYPLALYEAINNQRISRGDLVMLNGMGAGFTLAGLVLAY
jgi:3-oxoacyl-[acyl-carrier-protein] synthase-3